MSKRSKGRISSTIPQVKGKSRARTFYVVLFVGRPILPEEELYLRNNYNKMQVHVKHPKYSFTLKRDGTRVLSWLHLSGRIVALYLKSHRELMEKGFNGN
jgi:hypothetical protein